MVTEPDICGQLSPTIPPGEPNICRRPAGHAGVHMAYPGRIDSTWWTDPKES
jgi:hypothetical protein